MGATVSREAVPKQNVFTQLCAAGEVQPDDAWQAFNMGVGMILAVEADSADEFLQGFAATGQTAFLMGEVSDAIEGVAWQD
jgi:phosphoribosylformylglycinamidine cyclo-ligase